MPTEHLRENGGLAQGYFCMTCGQPSGMYGHVDCTPNPGLVKKLYEINDAGSLEQYTFNKLKATDNE